MATAKPDVSRFFEASANGDIPVLRGLLAADPSLVHIGNPDAPHQNWTGLHAAAQRGRLDAVRLLLHHGADPNAREAGDNTTPLHWAAAHGDLETVRTLLEAGSDPLGIGDVHELDTIGWATVFRPAGDVPHDVIALLLERGARHQIYSAIAIGDPELIRSVVRQTPGALDRRMSRFEHGQTPLHFAMSRRRYDILQLLIELGADVEAKDDRGQTALSVAMLRGDMDAMRLLHAVGAEPPKAIGTRNLQASMAKLAASVRKGVPMISVPDIAATLDWYTSIGFTEVGRYAAEGEVNWGMTSLGHAQIMFNLYGAPGDKSVSLWFYTNQIDQLYQLLKNRQLEAARAALAGEPAVHGIVFDEDLYEPFYGGRQFGIRDLNGYSLIFLQDEEPGEP